MENKTLLVIYPGTDVQADCCFTLLVANTGEGLCSHLCSHWGYAKGDLYSGRPERIKEFSKRFGEVEVKFIDETDIAVEELLKLNKEFHNKNKKQAV